jgi:hypothetical protein
MLVILIIFAQSYSEYVELEINSKVRFGWKFKDEEIEMTLKVFLI